MKETIRCGVVVSEITPNRRVGDRIMYGHIYHRVDEKAMLRAGIRPLMEENQPDADYANSAFNSISKRKVGSGIGR